MRKILELKGRKFGKLFVLGFSHLDKQRHKAIWHVQCECGNKFTLDSHTIKRENGVRQCNSCRLEQLWEGNRRVDAALTHLLAMYRNQARRSKRAFELSQEQFRQLTSSLCFYTGRAPSQIAKSRASGTYVYNGIDRKDNRKGYTPRNCVACCGIVNRMKGTMSAEEFIAVCKEVAKRHE